MKLFIVCLARYNENRKTGSWFDVSDFSSSKELEKAIDESTEVCGCKHLNHEEIAINDFEGFPKNMGEYTNIETVFQYLDIMNEINDADATRALAEYLGFEDFLKYGTEYTYHGEHSPGDYIYDLLMDIESQDVINFITRNSRHIDFENMESELEHDGYLFLNSDTYGKRHVFSPN
jgi:antirestriction protein